MVDYEEKLKKEVTYLENPFQIVNVETVTLGNLEKINQLDNSGRLVLKYVVSNLNQHTAITMLKVIDICNRQFTNYPKITKDKMDRFEQKVANTLEIRIRRGIKNLLYNKVIAKTKEKDKYFVNKSIIWR